MKTFKKLLGWLLIMAIIGSVLVTPAFADEILSVSTNTGGGMAYGDNDRYFFDMSYKLQEKIDGVYNLGSYSISTPLTPTWKANDPKDANNKVLKIDSTAGDAYAKINFRCDNPPNAGAYKSTGPQIIGYDFMISGVEAASTITEEPVLFFKSVSYGEKGWNSTGNEFLNIRKIDGKTVIKTYNGLKNPNNPAGGNDPEGVEIEQDKWYTCYVYTDWTYGKEANPDGKWSNNFASQMFMSEKGAGFENAWYVSTLYVDHNNTTYQYNQPVAKYILSNASKTVNGLTYYLDNLFIDSVVSIDDTKAYKQPGESTKVDFYVAPGFTGATVSAFYETVELTDNGTGYYSLNVNIPESAEAGLVDIEVNATYPKAHHFHSYGKTITATATPIIVTKNAYQYMKINDGSFDKPFKFTFDDGSTTPAIQNKIENQGAGTVTRTIDNGYDFENNAEDKSFKVSMTNINSGGYFLVGDYNHSYPKYPVSSMIKFKVDLKFDSDGFGLSMQNKAGSTWANYSLVDSTTKKFIGTDIEFKANTWYRLEFVYNLVENTIDSYVNGQAFATEPTNKTLAENFVMQVCAVPPEDGDLRTGTVWVDNLSKEIAPIYKGIKNYNPMAESNSTFTVELEEAVMADLVTAEVVTHDGQVAGTASIVKNTDSVLASTVTVTPNDVFTTQKDIVLVIKSGETELERKSFFLKDSASEAMSEISISQDDTRVYANISHISAENVGRLYLVGYNSDYSRITNITTVPVTESETLKNVKAALTKNPEDVNYKAFVWTDDFTPIELSASISKN